MIKFLMKTFQTFPSEKNFENWEVFNHDIYLKNTETKQKEIRKATCMARYDIEKDKKFSWMENYFLNDLKPETRWEFISCFSPVSSTIRVSFKFCHKPSVYTLVF